MVKLGITGTLPKGTPSSSKLVHFADWSGKYLGLWVLVLCGSCANFSLIIPAFYCIFCLNHDERLSEGVRPKVMPLFFIYII